MEIAPDKLLVEVDGEGVSPETVDVPSALELAAAFVALVRKLAADRDLSIEFHGLSIVDKCAAIATRVDNAAVARELAADALRLVNSPREDVPRGAFQYVERVRASVRGLPEGQHARIMVDGWSRDVKPEVEVAPPPAWERIALRARLLRIGGSSPLARFSSRHEPAHFSQRVDLDEARALAPVLYEEIDIEARVVRDRDGAIEQGDLGQWYALAEPGGDAWRKWFRENTIGAEEFEERRRGDRD